MSSNSFQLLAEGLYICRCWTSYKVVAQTHTLAVCVSTSWQWLMTVVFLIQKWKLKQPVFWKTLELCLWYFWKSFTIEISVLCGFFFNSISDFIHVECKEPRVGDIIILLIFLLLPQFLFFTQLFHQIVGECDFFQYYSIYVMGMKELNFFSSLIDCHLILALTVLRTTHRCLLLKLLFLGFCFLSAEITQLNFITLPYDADGEAI